MANVGEQLTQPESGMKRIDDAFYSIKSTDTTHDSGGNGNYNNTRTVLNKNSSKVEFYVYTSKLYILGDNYGGIYRCKEFNVSVDSVDEIIPYICNETDKRYHPQMLLYKKENMDKKIHHIIISLPNHVYDLDFTFDAIDIDEDGYMIYCDDNNKLYYDVTPIMTSNTTPEGYEASASSIYNNYYPYNAFDGNGSKSSLWISGLDAVKNQYLRFSFNKRTLINAFIVKSDSPSNCLKNFILKGLNENGNWEDIYKGIFTNNTTEKNFTQLFNFNTSKYKAYEIFFIDNQGHIAGDTGGRYIDITEIRFLLSVDTPFYLIKDNVVYKNYDEENNSLVEVQDTSILNTDAINNTCIYDLNKVKDLIDLKSNGVKVISNKNIKAKTKVLKSTKQMIIGSGDFSTRLADNIDYFKFQYNISDENCVIKTVLSIDSGKTWKSYINGNWECLENSVAIKDYSDLTELEKNNWNNLLDEILTKGINIKDINETLDFNSLDMEKCRFAYVIQISDANANTEAILKDLKWQFDSIGSYEQLSPKTDVNISITNEAIKIQPLKNMELIKINVSTPSQFSQPQKENEILNKFNINDNNKLTWNNSILYTEENINALNIKATNIIVDIKNGDNEETKTLQEVLNDILANGIQSQQTRAVCGTAICGTTTCGDL